MTNKISIGLCANKRLRTGPNSSLMRFVREFEPYFFDILQPTIYALQGSYQAVKRYGLLEDYGYLLPLPSGHDGGLVELADLVVGKKVDQVIYLIDPMDATSLFPESIALKRECVVAGIPFLSSYQAAVEWYHLEWYSRIPAAQGIAEEPFEQGFFVPVDLLADRIVDTSPRRRKPLDAQRLALIAHDNKKLATLDYAVKNFRFLDRFGSRTATGTTGTLLNGELPKDPNRLRDLKKNKKEWSEIEKKLKKLLTELENRKDKTNRWVNEKESGPKGGDVAIAAEIRTHKCQKVLFFEDPHVPRQHESDIQLLERTARIPGQDVLCLHDEGSASIWAANWEKCIKSLNGSSFLPATVYQAYQQLFGVELAITGSGRVGGEARNNPKSIWTAIKRDAARYLYSYITEMTEAHAVQGRKVRVAITWGTGMDELLDELELEKARIDRLAKSAGLTYEDATFGKTVMDLHLDNLLSLPMVGMMASTSSNVEANDHADRLSKIFSGEPVPVPHYVFSDKKEDFAVRINEKYSEHWDRLNLCIFGCDEVKEYFGEKAQAPVPTVLFQQMTNSAKCEISGIYLDRHGKELLPSGYRRIGVSVDQLRQVKKRHGAILIAGAEPERVEPVVAALRCGIVSTLVTNRAFARKVLDYHAASLESSSISM